TIATGHFTGICVSACANTNSGEMPGGNSLKATDIIDTFVTGIVIKNVPCKADSAQTYALYIPAHYHNKALPVMYFFDPHGDGSLPLNKYKGLADRYNFILIGSNISKNGNDFSASENIWRVMFDDSKKRLLVNTDRIYACGFSGGAKVAGYIGLHHAEIKGVIANGAGLPDATVAGDFNFSFTALAGQGDMNMTDLVATNSNFDKTQTKHRIILFAGKHEWAPETAMSVAFAGLQFDAMYHKLIAVNDTMISNFVAGSKNDIAACLQGNNYLKAELQCKLCMNMLDGLSNEVAWFKQKDAVLQSDPVYQKQLQAEQKLFNAEQNAKGVFMQQFQQADMNYWIKTISELRTKSTVKTAEGAMNQRLLAYLSLAFYTISEQLITAGQDKDGQYFVALYKLSDPVNSEAWYFSAILNARKNDIKATENDLLMAVKYGFADKGRLLKEADFQKAGMQNILHIILNKINTR
ncbi:MAG: hypothetical protein ABIN95_10175, partial [Mucilaginibacter sp.]